MEDSDVFELGTFQDSVLCKKMVIFVRNVTFSDVENQGLSLGYMYAWVQVWTWRHKCIYVEGVKILCVREREW